ncbi:hypothetical protein Tco_0128684 [Tanacetum coccineum]
MADSFKLILRIHNASYLGYPIRRIGFTFSILHIGKYMTLPPKDQRYEWLRFDNQGYTKEEKQEFKTRLAKIYYRRYSSTRVLMDQSPDKGRKAGAQMLGGHFIAQLGIHFRVITEQSLQTLTVEDGVAGGDTEIDPKIPQDPPMDQEDVTKSRGAGASYEYEPRAAACDVRGDDERACQVNGVMMSCLPGDNPECYFNFGIESVCPVFRYGVSNPMDTTILNAVYLSSDSYWFTFLTGFNMAYLSPWIRRIDGPV